MATNHMLFTAADNSKGTTLAVRCTKTASSGEKESGAAEGRFVLEAKTGPNCWRKISQVYPDLDLVSFFNNRETANKAKAELKSLLLGPLKGRFPKKPIRLREVEPANSENSNN